MNFRSNNKSRLKNKPQSLLSGVEFSFKSCEITKNQPFIDHLNSLPHSSIFANHQFENLFDSEKEALKIINDCATRDDQQTRGLPRSQTQSPSQQSLAIISNASLVASSFASLHTSTKLSSSSFLFSASISTSNQITTSSVALQTPPSISVPFITSTSITISNYATNHATNHVNYWPHHAPSISATINTTSTTHGTQCVAQLPPHHAPSASHTSPPFAQFVAPASLQQPIRAQPPTNGLSHPLNSFSSHHNHQQQKQIKQPSSTSSSFSSVAQPLLRHPPPPLPLHPITRCVTPYLPASAASANTSKLYKQFDRVDDPFDDLHLKSMNEIEELRNVFSTTSCYAADLFCSEREEDTLQSSSSCTSSLCSGKLRHPAQPCTSKRKHRNCNNNDNNCDDNDDVDVDEKENGNDVTFELSSTSNQIEEEQLKQLLSLFHHSQNSHQKSDDNSNFAPHKLLSVFERRLQEFGQFKSSRLSHCILLAAQRVMTSRESKNGEEEEEVNDDNEKNERIIETALEIAQQIRRAQNETTFNKAELPEIVVEFLILSSLLIGRQNRKFESSWRTNFGAQNLNRLFSEFARFKQTMHNRKKQIVNPHKNVTKFVDDEYELYYCALKCFVEQPIFPVSTD